MSSTFKRTLRIPVPVVFLGVIGGLGGVLVQAQGPALSWEQAAPFPEPEEELFGVTANGRMYVIGGYGTNGGPAPSTVHEYDAAVDRWTEKSPIPIPVHHQAQALYDGKIYVFGGCMRPLSGPGMNGWEPVDNAWEYDPAADSWTALAPMPGRRCAAIAEEVGGKIYVIGGRQASAHVTVASNTDVVEEYDPARDLWGAVKAPMPTPRSGGGSAVHDGKIYTAGSEYQSDRFHASFRALEVYDPAANRWTSLPSMPSARHGLASAFIGNRLHLVSGKPKSGGLPDLAGRATEAHDVLEIPASFWSD